MQGCMDWRTWLKNQIGLPNKFYGNISNQILVGLKFGILLGKFEVAYFKEGSELNELFQ